MSRDLTGGQVRHQDISQTLYASMLSVAEAADISKGTRYKVLHLNMSVPFVLVKLTPFVSFKVVKVLLF